MNTCTETTYEQMKSCRESPRLSYSSGGENLNNLRYADDTALLAESESILQDIVDVVRQNSEEKGLSMNVKQTKTMVVCRDEIPDVRIVVNG